MYIRWVNQLNIGLPLVPMLMTDQDQYQVGESIRATLVYVNPNSHSVSFTPPSHVFISFHEWPLSSLSRPLDDPNADPAESSGLAQLDWRATWLVVEAGEKVTVFSYEFTATRVGTFLVILGEASKEIRVTG